MRFGYYYWVAPCVFDRPIRRVLRRCSDRHLTQRCSNSERLNSLRLTRFTCCIVHAETRRNPQKPRVCPSRGQRSGKCSSVKKKREKKRTCCALFHYTGGIVIYGQPCITIYHFVIPDLQQ